ncbi:MAG: MBL fold metallo-hydrolase [Bacteroidota bacterium]
MKIRFWGVQGSVPNPLTTAKLRHKIRSILERSIEEELTSLTDIDEFIEELPLSLNHTTGGNTTCYEIISSDGQRIFIDAGTGIRKLGNHLMHANDDTEPEYHLLMTHLHWDHINGFPFFGPAYQEGCTIHIYGVHDYLEQGYQRQFHPHNFPIQFEDMSADIQFHVLDEGEPFDLGPFSINTQKLDHPNDSYAYRVTEGENSIVIATDAEYKRLDNDFLKPFIEFYQDSDLIVFDSQYTMKEMLHKAHWGHSSPFVGVDVCLMANIPHLVMTHYDPSYSDDDMNDILARTESFKQHAMKSHANNFQYDDLDITLAYEGLELDI